MWFVFYQVIYPLKEIYPDSGELVLLAYPPIPVVPGLCLTVASPVPFGRGPSWAAGVRLGPLLLQLFPVVRSTPEHSLFCLLLGERPPLDEGKGLFLSPGPRRI